MLSPKTIDITTSNVIFEDADPVGLLPELSAKSYLEALRERVAEAYPKARVFLKWVPTRRTPADVLTLPRVESAENRLRELAEEVREARTTWIRHDENVRAAFGT
ncbi:MAG: hypothetical protein H6719_09595 [Sandaracinaceae bacterium]|nr:hypothetical protein [Sandaracinaceae bacterium]